MQRIDRRPLQITKGELLSVVVVRNERLRLPYFLEYHRGLGIDRFLVIDNDSVDGSTELLLDEPDVHVFHTAQRYAASGYGVTWMNALLEAHASGHWVLTVDADELLVYPGCEEANLRELTSLLDYRHTDAMLTFLLDMYSDRPIHSTHYLAGTPFLKACPFFDADTYVWDETDQYRALVPSRGGARARIFWGDSDRGRPPPYLPKIPLVRWKTGRAYRASTHLLPGASLADVTGALLHFKFFSDFPRRAAEEAARGEHWQGAAQYEIYRQVLEERPDLKMSYEGSVRYRSSGQLVALGLLHVGAASSGSP